MSRVPNNELFDKQQKKLVRATFKKGIINAVHAASATVDVAYAENPQTIVRGVPVANSVNLATVMAGQRCRIDLFDETNPADCVLAYVY